MMIKKNTKEFFCQLTLQREKFSLTAGMAIINKNLKELNLLKNYFIHADEEKYYNTLETDRRKLSFLLGRLTAKQSISIITDEKDLYKINIQNGVFNQPIVMFSRNSNIQVSISHSENLCAALAFPEAHPMAIDIEQIDSSRNLRSFFQLSKLEEDYLSKHALNEVEGLTLCWTIKESISKVLKTGLMTDFRIYEISNLDKSDCLFISTFSHFAQYKTISWFFENNAFSIVIPKKTTINMKSVIDILNKVWYE